MILILSFLLFLFFFLSSSSAIAPGHLALRQVFPPLLLQRLQLSPPAPAASSSVLEEQGGPLWRLAQSHLQQAGQNSSAPLPFLGCGPSLPASHLQRQLARARELLGPELVHVARLSGEEEGEACLLLYASPEEVLRLTRDKWYFSPVPYLLKMHGDVLSRLEEKEPLSSSSAAGDNDSLGTKQPVRPGEGLELSIRFFPGVKYSAEDWDSLLQTWAQQESASHAFQRHLSVVNEATGSSQRPLHSWETLRQKHIVRREGSSAHKLNAEEEEEEEEGGSAHRFDHCAVPRSANIKFHPSASASDAVVAKVADLSGWAVGADSSSMYCLVKFLEVLSAHDAVLSLNIQHRPVLLNYDVRGITQSGSARSTPFSDAGLYGTGQVVGIADSGLDDKSCFFWDNSNYYSSPYTTRVGYGSSSVESKRRKVIQYTAFADGYDSAAGHGTHVVGTVVGSSISADFSRANGVAPGAKVAFYDIQKASQSYLDLPSLASALFPAMYKAGARVFSNSWGSPGADVYSDNSYDVDSYTYNNPDVLVLFASGNSGADGSKSIFSPCSSKNALCVGSIDSRNDDDDGTIESSRVSYFSSQGPTGDGRIKPDVVAPGFKVVSALAGGQNGGDKHCGVYETFGTSMATPTVSGGALVLREYFLNVWSSVCSGVYSHCKSFSPSGYLLKALIIHSGQAVARYSQTAFDSKTDISSYTLGSPPDSVQGYGSVNLNNVVPLTVKQRDAQDLYIMDSYSMSGRSTSTLSVLVQFSKRPLKVTLVWYDMPATVGNANNILIFNLDLVVTSPSGDYFYGNGINGDSVNPQEQVYIASPTKGTYTISVKNMGAFTVQCAIVVTCTGGVTSELSLAGSIDTLDVSSLGEPSGQTSLSMPASSYVNTDPNEFPAVVPEPAAVAAYTSPLLSNFDLVKSYTIHQTLAAEEKVLLKSFEMDDDSLELFSIELSLDAHFCSGSEAFIFAIIVVVPNGEIIQLGGYNEYAALDRLWHRMWPVQWTATSAPADGGTYWRSTRYVVDMEIAQTGLYEVYIQLLHDSWESTQYTGNVKLNFVDAATALNRSKSASGGFFSSLGAVGAGFVIFFLVAIVVFGVAMIVKKRREINDPTMSLTQAQPERTKSVFKRKKSSNKRSKLRSGEDEDVPWSNISGLLSDMSDVSSSDVENPIVSPSDKPGTEVKTEARHKRYASATKNEV